MDHILQNLLSKVHTHSAASFCSLLARGRISSLTIAETIFHWCIPFSNNDLIRIMWLKEEVSV